jgi:glutamyl-tRNA synthetase
MLNSNFEEWRLANPDTPLEEFKFTTKKMSVSGFLFDLDKLNDISKNVISRMTADEVYDFTLTWAKENDEEFAAILEADRDYAVSILSIGRGGKKPRKDFGTWSECKGYMGFFFDELFTVKASYDEKFDRTDIKATLNSFIKSFDMSDDMNTWFDKIKAIGEELGYTSDMKAYKASPDSFKGSVADVSMFIRVAVTGKLNSPDMYAVMQILGKDRIEERINNMISTL